MLTVSSGNDFEGTRISDTNKNLQRGEVIKIKKLKAVNNW